MYLILRVHRAIFVILVWYNIISKRGINTQYNAAQKRHITVKAKWNFKYIKGRLRKPASRGSLCRESDI